MKRVNKCGVIIGILIGAVAASVFWISLLPGAPSQYGPKFPMTKEPLPTNILSRVISGTVGFDVYTNAKAPPDIKKNEALPVRKRSSWTISAQKNGYFYIYETIWIEYGGSLYRIGHFEKKVSGEANRIFPMTKELAVDKSRQITERVTIPAVGFDETFGPFPFHP